MVTTAMTGPFAARARILRSAVRIVRDSDAELSRCWVVGAHRVAAPLASHQPGTPRPS